MKKYCLNCGKKFYPKGYYAYPETVYRWNGTNTESTKHEVPLDHKHFHSLGCMKEWLAKNHVAFTDLVLTVMGNNDTNNESINRKE